jgi:hypothetical protein
LEARAISLTGKIEALSAEGLSTTATPAKRAAVLQTLVDLHGTVTGKLETLLAEAYDVRVKIEPYVVPAPPLAADSEEVAA